MTRRKRRRALPPDAVVGDTVALFQALSNPLRLKLLLTLIRRGALSAGELQDEVDAEQSAVSHQLAALRKARLVAVERDGRRKIYSILDDHVAHIVEDAVKHTMERD